MRIVDRRGRCEIDNPKAINDPAYGGWTDGRLGFWLANGRHHLDGQSALAYARSRKGSGDNDFTRSRRQQQLLVALRASLTDPSMLPELSLIIDAGKTLRTNFPQDRLGELLEVGRASESEDGIKRFVLGPPYATYSAGRTPGDYQPVPIWSDSPGSRSRSSAPRAATRAPHPDALSRAWGAALTRSKRDLRHGV